MILRRIDCGSFVMTWMMVCIVGTPRRGVRGQRAFPTNPPNDLGLQMPNAVIVWEVDRLTLPDASRPILFAR
jgi:hypothetical protein